MKYLVESEYFKLGENGILLLECVLYLGGLLLFIIVLIG